MKIRIKLLFVFLFFFMFSAVSVKADYGVKSIYQKTEFNSSKWVQSNHNCTLNTTTGVITLEKSVKTPKYENFLNYTEVDPNNRISETLKRVTFNGDLRTGYTGLYRCMNPVFTSDFDYYFVLYITSWENVAPYFRVNLITICDGLNDWFTNIGNNINQLSVMLQATNTEAKFRLVLLETTSGNTYIGNTTGFNLDTGKSYYMRYNRTDKLITLTLYNNPDYTGELYVVYDWLHNDYNSLNYVFFPQSTGYATAVNTNGYMEYLEMGNITYNYINKGVIYTKELLSNTTLKSVMIGINGTASTSTRIRVYASSDNSTWNLQIDNNALGTVYQYEEILYEYSTLYVRVNMTTTDKTKTPYVDELFYLHTYEFVTGSGTKPYVFIIIFTIIGLILGYRIDRT